MPTPGRTHTRGTRGGNGRYARGADTAERDANACRLRTEGATYSQIADQLGYADRAHARQAVERGLVAIVAEPAIELRTLELARLDLALAEAFAVLRRRHVVVSHGRIITDPETGEPLRDDGPVLAAVDRIVRIGERRCKLLGLDAPTRVEAITIDQVDAEIARLSAKLGITS